VTGPGRGDGKGTWFHPGEAAVQDRAGVRAEAERLEGMLAPALVSGGAARFLGARRLAALTARDHDGRLWISPLSGPAGFLDAGDTDLAVHAAPLPGDPLCGLPAGQDVGLVAVEFATRRRFRVNGTLASSSPGGLSIIVRQAFGNCPSYIQRRDILFAPAARAETASPAAAPVRASLTSGDRALIGRSDTLLLGTALPGRGADASHKGGHPGFARAEARGDVWWPDYAGNNLFNSMGNIAANPEAALLFIDFDHGATLQLSGSAALEWTEHGGTGDDGGTGRRIRVSPQAVTSAVRLPIRATQPEPSPHNPALR